jgi:hypothetical protein
MKSWKYAPCGIVDAVIKLYERHAKQALNVVQHKAKEKESAGGA